MNIRIRLILLVLLPVAPAAGQESTYGGTLQAGDAVRIEVWRQPELSGEFMIGAGGTIEHPLYRTLHVAGVDLARVETLVGELLARYESQPQFVLQPLLKVSVGGEVRQPSLYRVTPATSIAEAIAMAGGATERGNLEEVRLFRGGEAIEVDLTHPEAGMAQQPIRSGDQIFVDRRVSIWREYIAPAGSVMAALVSLVAVLTR